MALPLNDRQRRAWQFIATQIDSTDVPPTLAEIGVALGGLRPQDARAIVVALARKGYVAYAHHQPRSLRLLRWPDDRQRCAESFRLPIRGIVAAGSPIEPCDPHTEHEWIGADWARRPDSYLLRVRGNSMIGDGILDGDIVVVEPAEHAENGETVVALLADGTVTLKRIYWERDRVRLQPANPQFEPMSVPSVQVQGRVVAVLRRLAK